MTLTFLDSMEISRNIRWNDVIGFRQCGYLEIKVLIVSTNEKAIFKRF